MIPSSTNVPQSEASSRDALGLPRASKKKGASSLASLFSSLVEKAGFSKDAVSSGAVGESGKPGAERSKQTSPVALPKLQGGQKDSRPEVGAQRSRTLEAALASSLKKPAGSPSLVVGGEALSANFASAASKSGPAGKSSESKSLMPEGADSSTQRKDRLNAAAKKVSASDKKASDAELLNASLGAGASIAASRASLGKNEAAGKTDKALEGVESNKKDKKDKKDRLEISVFDQRSGQTFGGPQTEQQRIAAADQASSDASSQTGADLVIHLREGSGEGGAGKSGSAKAGTGASFADSLARELRETYNGDIVKQASVVLKNGGDGLLRLSLRPDSLGSVKIKLELTDNKIAGRILVETDEALKAFSKELRSLEQAFVDGGFDGASLELALSSGDAGTGSGNRNGADAPQPFFSERLIASEYDSAVPAADTAPSRFRNGREDALIDMMA